MFCEASDKMSILTSATKKYLINLSGKKRKFNEFCEIFQYREKQPINSMNTPPTETLSQTAPLSQECGGGGVSATAAASVVTTEPEAMPSLSKLCRSYTITNEDDIKRIESGVCPEYAEKWSKDLNDRHWPKNYLYATKVEHTDYEETRDKPIEKPNDTPTEKK